MEEEYLSRGKAAKAIGVHPLTIWRWTKASKIKAITTPKGQYRYPLSEIKRIKGEVANAKENGTRALIYARVSSHDQKQQGDLDRQLKRLRDYAFEHELHIIDEITDIASGLNTERKGLKKVYKYVKQGEVDKVLVTYRDRLTRFGFGYLTEFFDTFGVSIIVLEQEGQSPQEEMVQDLIKIITSFRWQDTWHEITQESIGAMC